MCLPVLEGREGMMGSVRNYGVSMSKKPKPSVVLLSKAAQR